jgi:phospholipid-translocating ATPase
MCQAPVLVHLQQRGLPILDTDASDDGVGGVLSQIQDGEERVLYYFSQTMNSNQRNYCATKRELLAVVVDLRKCKHYLCWTHFLLSIDHASLVWLVNFKNHQG